jgi:hypothetical protein
MYSLECLCIVPFLFGRPQLVLKCIAPEGSPMQHRMFTLDGTGATIGRKQTNLVSLSQEKGAFPFSITRFLPGEIFSPSTIPMFKPPFSPSLSPVLYMF